MIIQHDIIDRRKVKTVAKATASATFSNGLELDGLGMKMQAFDQNYGEGQAGTCQRHFMAPLLAYFYRGVRPTYYKSDHPADVVAAQMIEAVDKSPLLGHHKALSKHNIWSADIVTAVVANLLLPEPPPEDGKGNPPPPQQGEDDEQEGGGASSEGEDEQEQDGEGAGGEEEGDGDQQDGDGQGDGGEGDQEGESEPKEGEEGNDDDDRAASSGNGADSEVRDLVTEATTARGGDEDVEWHDFQSRVERRLNEANTNLRAMKAPTMTNSGTNRGGDVSLTDAMEATQGQQQKLEVSPFVASAQWGSSMYVEAQRVNDLMGRLQSTLTGAMADRVKYAPSTPVKITMGGNLSLALKHQFVHLDEPSEVLLQKQWLGHELMQREVTGIVRAGKGPIIMCIDVSGSMYGMKMEWAMALAGALGWAAAKRKREVAYVYYSSTVPDILHIPSKLRNDHKALDRAIGSVVHNVGIGNRQWHPHSIMDDLNAKGITKRDGSKWERTYNGGGTNYWMALEGALAVMLSNKKWLNADVLFLSDGGDTDCPASPNARGALAHSRISTRAKKPKMNAAVSGRSNPASMAGRSFVSDLNKLGARVYGIGLVQTVPGQEPDRELEIFKRSMGYFNSYVVAGINEKTNAEHILRIIGRNL